MTERPRVTARVPLLVWTAFALTLTATAWASAPAGRSATPRLIGPDEGVVASELGLRFAWAPTPGAMRNVLVASKTPFDARAWTELPQGEVYRVIELARPFAGFADLGMKLEGEQPLYWAVGSSQTRTGRLLFSETRTVRVIPKFSNRLAPTPFLSASPIGKATPVADSGPRRIRLAAGYTIDPSHGEPALPAALRGMSSPQSNRTFLMYYGDADPEQVRQQINQSGGTIVSFIPDHTYLVRMKAEGGITLDSPGAWVGVYQPAYKLSSDLDLGSATAREVSVLAFIDGDLGSIEAAVLAAGGTVVRRSSNGINKILRVSLPGVATTVLAQHPDIAWIEPHVQPTLDNVNAQWVVQTNSTNNRRLWDLGLKGEGQVIHHSDTGIDMTHEMFNDPGVPVATYGSYPTHRKVIAYENGSVDPTATFGDYAGASNHGSHTSGTTAGNDLTLPLAGNDGLAKAGRLWHSDLAGPTTNGLSPFEDLNDLYQPSYTGNAGGAARISTNSWGAAVAGVYTVNSLAIDQFMWNHPDYLIFFSNGNSGGASTVGAPATAKNCVSVGGTRNSTSSGTIYSSTSRGPTVDLRRKPTICAPAQSLTSANVGPSTYATLAGTSMASPAAAGVAALMRQYCTEGWYPTGTKVPANGFSPSAALLKAIVVNSGVNQVSGFNAPDNNIGYGRINADSVLYFAGDKRRLLMVDQTEGLGTGQMIEYQVNVVNDSSALEATLVWTDYPGNPAAAIQLVNDLNLTVTNGIVTYRGNIYSGGFSVVGGGYDPLNVEEAVLVKVPAPGLWTIRVEGANVPLGPQPFGLVITGGVGTNAGAVTLDRASYGSSSVVQIEVLDTNAGGSVNVTVTSPTEPGGEVVTLPGSNGVYTGSLVLSPYPGVTNDGTLQVSNGDVFTATYSDADPVAGVARNAVVSFNPPVITNVAASSPATGTATVVWTTDKNATSRVYYGTTPALGSSSTLDLQSVFAHSATLTGVVVEQDYYYDVESKDLNGNVTRDDNGAQHYRFRFSTRPPSDLLLMYGGTEFERPDRYNAALTELGWLFDTWSGTLSDQPELGNLSQGLRQYRGIWWQPELDLYPPVSDSARVAIDQYFGGGGRLAICGHDIAWSNCDPTSPYFTADRCNWTQQTLKTIYQLDPAGWSQVIGVAADPISGPYTAGLPYAEHRPGAAGDEIDPTPDATAMWFSNDGTPDQAGVRWESPATVGNPLNARWGGKKSRLASMSFEWSGIDNAHEPSSPMRAEVMKRTLAWLMGRDKPYVTVTAPNGGEVLTGNSVNITWTESTDGTNVAQRIVEYSLDGGLAWTVLSASAGASPFVWNLTSVTNTLNGIVRVRLTDDGDPSLTGVDASNATFKIQRAGGDAIGPVVVAGSIQTNPNPVVNTATTAVAATINDALSGGSNIQSAEWSAGPAPAAAGSGHAMSGTFTTTTVAVNATIPIGAFTPATIKLWVRGRDAAGNWGTASQLTVVVNGNASVAVETGLPRSVELRQNAPNPVQRTTSIAFALPQPARVKLGIFDIGGRKIRVLASGAMSAGRHTVQWDRSDERGRIVQPGVYYTRLEVDGKTYQRKIVTLN